MTTADIDPPNRLASRVRTNRARAERLALRLSQSRGLFTVYDATGRALTAGDLDDVERWLIDRTRYPKPGPAAKPTPPAWAPWVDMFIAEQQAAKRRPGTITTRVKHLLVFARSRPDVTPMTVTRDDLVSYIGSQQWHPRTVHGVRASFRLFFRLLVDLGHRMDDPARTLPAVRIPRSVPRPCPDHVVKAAYATLEDDRLRTAVRITVETGLRRSEVARVRSADVEGRQDAHHLHVVGKGGHERSVPISNDLAKLILSAPTEYLFAGRTGAPLTSDHLGKLIAQALPGAWTAHTLRHRFATMAYQATSDLRAVQELLGHASPTTTAVYTRVADDAMRRAAEAAHIS